MELNKYFDHTLLKPDASSKQIMELCMEAKKYKFASVCVNSSYVPLAAEFLLGEEVSIASVVGFPLGQMATEAKAFETKYACENGADEIDMVINIGALKEKSYDFVRDDISAVVEAAAEYHAIVKVILETGILSDDEIVKACEISMEAGAAFVKTSTGFGYGGATAHAVKLMKDTVGDNAKVKASGGIRDLKTCLEMIEAGADRIGASASVQIVEEYMKQKN